MSQLVDRYLLYRINAKHDAEAFAQIYNRHVEAIYRFVFFKLPRKEDAQDVTAEAFTRLWQQIQSKKNITNLKAFLYQIARNLVVDFYRKNEKDKSVVISDVTEGDESASNVLPTDQGRNSDLMETRGEIAIILGQLTKLKEDYRDVLALHLIDDLSFTEIGAILGKDPGHIRVIYHRGLKAIKAINQA